MSSKNISALSRHKSYTEEETKSSSKMESIAMDPDDDFNDSVFGSISEGRESVLIQKVPHLECLLSHNAVFSDATHHYPRLYEAVCSNDAETCKQLLQEKCVDVANRYEDNNTLLHIAACYGHLKVCMALLDYSGSIDINADNELFQSPLHLSCRNGHLQVSQLLLRSGADVNKKDSQSNTPLHLAAISNHAVLVAWLLTRNPNLNLRNAQGDRADECGGTEVAKAFEKYLKRTVVTTGPAFIDPQKLHGTRVEEERITPGHFTILKELGKGSFGEVFLVSKQDSEQLYAMKVLEKQKIISQNLVKYAITERNVMSYMKHPFIVSLNFAFQSLDRLFLIIDYCPGGDLGRLLSTEKRFSESRARIYLCEVVLALEELHKHNIIFRDLKPDNIVLDEDGHALLTDFGLSKEQIFDNYQTHSFCGSLAYLAPEVIRRQGHGKAVDWYLLGVVFYEMVVGRPPYFSMNKNELLANIQKGKLKIPSSLSQEAKELIIDLLQRDPSKRLGSTGDAEDIKAHRFFRGIDWGAVYRRELCPPKVPRTEIPKTGIPAEDVYGNFFSANPNKIHGWTFISK